MNSTGEDMKRIQIFVILLLCVSCAIQSAFAQNDMLSMPLVVDVPEEKDFTKHSDITYRSDEGTKVLADIYQPLKGESHSAVIFVHGGPVLDLNAEKPKNWKVYRDYGALATKHGLVGVTFNHRMNSLIDFATPAEDIKALTQFVQQSSDQYGIDKNKICVWFFSAGGNFVAPLLKEKPNWLQCVVVYYGAMGLDVFKEMGAQLKIPNPELYDPIPIVSEKSDGKISLFVAEAGADNPALNKQLRKFTHTAIENSWPVEYWNHPTGPHAFDILSDDARSGTIIHRTFEFLKEKL